MAACVTTPRQTVYSTPVNVQTITNSITRTITNPGATVTQTVYYTQCIDDPIIISRFRRLKRQVECPNGTTVSTSYIVSESAPETITSTDISYDYVTNRGDPVAVDTQYGTSCSDIETTPSPSPRTTTTTPAQTSPTFTSIFVPSSTPQPSPISRSIASTSTSSSASATATQDNVVVGHKSTKIAAIAGGAAGAVLFLAAVAGAIWYFKFFKAGGAGKSGHHGHHGGEKGDIDGTSGGGGGASGAHAPGHGHVAHNVPPHHLGGTGVETSGVGGGGGGAGGPAGTAPGGGGVGMDTSAVAGGGYGGTAPPTSGLEGQYVNTLPPGASAPAHHVYPVIVPVGARRRESQGPQEMVNTVSTPWIDPAQLQQQQQSGYYYPQQGPQQPWQNADPYASASPAQYPGSGPGWADQAYYASQAGYSQNGAQYPADPRMSQGGYPADPRMSQGGYPVDPRASGAYYPTSTAGHTSPVSNANPNRMSVISSPSSVDHPRHSLLPYMNEYGAPQPGPSVASTPAPPTSTTDTSADPFDKHAEASASAAAGPSDHELPPPSYDEAGASAQPFVPQDAKGRPQ